MFIGTLIQPLYLISYILIYVIYFAICLVCVTPNFYFDVLFSDSIALYPLQMFFFLINFTYILYSFIPSLFYDFSTSTDTLKNTYQHPLPFLFLFFFHPKIINYFFAMSSQFPLSSETNLGMKTRYTNYSKSICERL